MTCNLRKNGLYTLSRVTYNTESGLYTTYLSNPPSTCSDGVLTSHKATVSVVPGIPSPTLAYDDTAHRPIITVANSRAIEFVSPPTGPSFFAIFLTLSLAAFAVALFTGMFRSLTSSAGADGTVTVGSGRRRRQYRGRYNSTSAPAQQAAPQTVVVNQGNDGLLTGVLLGEALSGHRDHETVVHEREIIHERNTSPTTQDTDDSYSSDDSSSSDSDSFSSDSGSDSGSFGSDSGGGDFGGGSFGND